MLITMPDRRQFVDQALGLLRELDRFLVFERNNNGAVLHAIAIFLGNDVDESREETLQPRDIGGRKQIGQRGLYALAPRCHSGSGNGRVVRFDKLGDFDLGSRRRRHTSGLQEGRGKTGKCSNLGQFYGRVRRSRFPTRHHALQFVEKLPCARNLPTDIFFRETVRDTRLPDLLRRLLEKQTSFVCIGEFRQRNQVPPCLGLRHSSRALNFQHFQCGNLLEQTTTRSDFRRQFVWRGSR